MTGPGGWSAADEAAYRKSALGQQEAARHGYDWGTNVTLMGGPGLGHGVIEVNALPGGKNAWIGASPEFANQYPGATVRFAGEYYRALIPTATFQLAQQKGMSREEIFTVARRNALLPVSEQVKALAGKGYALETSLGRSGILLMSPAIQEQIRRELRALEVLKGKELFNKQVELGLIPRGSVYISKREYLPASEVQKIKEQSPELHKILTTEGWSAYQAKVEEYQQEYEQYRKELEAFEQSLKTNSPDLYKIYKEKGIEAYNAEVGKRADEYNALIKKLAPYKEDLSKWSVYQAAREAGKVRELEQAIPATYTIEGIAKFLQNNPDFDPAKLVTTVGFSQEAIDEAIKYNKQPWVAETPGERLFEAIRNLSPKDAEQLRLFALADAKSGYGWLGEVLDQNPKIRELMKATDYDPDKVSKPEMSLVDFTQAFLVARDYNEAEDDKWKSKRHELELLARMEYARLYGAGAITATDNLAFMSRDLYELVARASPTGTSVPAQVGRGALTGAADLLVGLVTLPIVGLETMGHLVSGKPGKAGALVINTGVGIKDYFVLLGSQIVAQPAEGIPRATVALLPIIHGVGKAGIRAVKGATAMTAPHGLPMRAMAIELDVSRVPFRKAGYETTLKAVAEALEQQLKTEPTDTALVGKVIVKIGDKVIELKYRRTSIQTEVPDTLYHATSDKYHSTPDAPAIMKQIEQKGYAVITKDLYTSPQAAMDFLRGSSSGVPPKNPAIIAIRTANLKGFRMPFKSYMGKVEAEVVGSEGVKLYPTEPNTFSKVFGKGVTGETFTQYKGPSQTFGGATIKSGQLVPIYWLKTAGAKGGTPSIGMMYTATGLAFFESIKDLPYLRPRQIKFSFWGGEGALLPFKSARKTYKLMVKATKELETEAAENVKKIAKKGWTEADYAKAYRLELKRLVDSETQRLLKMPEVKEALRRNRAAFEQAYTINLAKYYALAALGSQGRLREARLERERPEIVTTYRYRNGRLTRGNEEIIRRREREVLEERLELIPRRRREVPPARRERPALTTTRRRGVPPPERSRIPPITRRRIFPPPERRRVPPPERQRVPPPVPKTGIPLLLSSSAEIAKAKRKEFAGAVTWKQGFGWWAIKAPYASQADVAFFRGKPPPNAEIVKGGPKSAFRSIQTITGKPPEKLKVDLGIMDILISKPKKKPGAAGAISFKQDVEQKPGGDITITSTGKVRPKVTKGEVEESVAINPLKGNKMPTEIAKQIGSYSAKITPEGKLKIKVRRL